MNQEHFVNELEDLKNRIAEIKELALTASPQTLQAKAIALKIRHENFEQDFWFALRKLNFDESSIEEVLERVFQNS